MPVQKIQVQEQNSPVAEDNVAGVLKTELRYSYTYQAGTTAGVTIKSGAGFLHSVTIAPLATATITLYDNTAASGTVIFQSTAMIAGNPCTIILDVSFSTGLELVIATANANVTVSWR